MKTSGSPSRSKSMRATPPPSDSMIAKFPASSPLRYVNAIPEEAVMSANGGGPASSSSARDRAVLGWGGAFSEHAGMAASPKSSGPATQPAARRNRGDMGLLGEEREYYPLYAAGLRSGPT